MQNQSENRTSTRTLSYKFVIAILMRIIEDMGNHKNWASSMLDQSGLLGQLGLVLFCFVCFPSWYKGFPWLQVYKSSKHSEQTHPKLTTLRIIVDSPAVELQRQGLLIYGHTDRTIFGYGSLECTVVVLRDKSKGVYFDPSLQSYCFTRPFLQFKVKQTNL